MPSQLLNTVLNGLISFRKSIEHKSDYQEELADLNQLIENISAPLNIMVMGEFSTGKSTFINALLGKKVLKMADTPTTAVITKLCYGDEDTITVYFKDSTAKICTSEEFDELTASEDVKGKSIHATIDYVERKLPIDTLKQAIIIDSPGLNAIRREDEKITRHFMENADTILLLYDINKMNSKLENNLLNNLNERLQPIGIVNKIDDFDEEEEEQSLEEFLAEQKQTIGAKVSKLIGVSAKQALEGQLTNNPDLVKESNIIAVGKAINTTVLENRDKFKFYSFLDKIGNVLSKFGKAAQEIAEQNKQQSDYNYNSYVQKQTDILGIMEQLGNIAKPIYEVIKTQSDKASCKMFLGILYYYGILLDKNPVRAFNYLEAGAIKNNEIAQIILVDDFLRKENYERVIYWATKLTQNGNPKGQDILGFCYANGLGVEKNEHEAFKWYKQAADQNYVPSQYITALYYEEGIGTEKNLDKAFALYQKTAKQNIPEAQCRLAQFYLNGICVNTDTYKAFKLFKRAAIQGIAKAQNYLGVFYEKGISVTKDLDNAFHWYLKSAKQGYVEAQYNLAVFYSSGTDAEVDNISALYWFKQAANQGHIEAAYYLFIHYANGLGTQKNYDEAIKWLKKAAQQNLPKAQYKLGMCYLNADYNLLKDTRKSFDWISAAAKQNLVSAQRMLGIFYDQGIGIGKNVDEALVWYKKAAEANDAEAQYLLAKYYQRELGRRCPQVYELYKKAAIQGHAKAQYELAICYQDGIGTTKNWHEAVNWLRKAADQNLPKAQCELAKYQKNDTEAVRLLEKSAEQGYAPAQNYLGVRYAEGKGVPTGKATAVYWYQKAANQGHMWAQRNLAVAYSNGEGVNQNDEQAFYWYKKAADQGLAEAQNYVGVCYDNGIGTNISYTKAVEYYTKAAKQNEPWAQYNLALCYQNGSDSASKKQAYSLFQKSAEQNVPDAQYEVALCYLNGIGTEIDKKKAFYWLSRAVENNYKKAIYDLAQCYEKGIGTDFNEKEAFNLMQKAASTGSSKALYILGSYYIHGVGIKRNTKQGLKLWQKAADLGNNTAKEKLKKMEGLKYPGCNFGCLAFIIYNILFYNYIYEIANGLEKIYLHLGIFKHFDRDIYEVFYLISFVAIWFLGYWLIIKIYTTMRLSMFLSDKD